MHTDPLTAIFAGGCFWCIEGAFTHTAGVLSATSGYIGGTLDNPTYEEVCSDTTGHREAVKVSYDPSVISYGELVELFFRQIDPTDPGGQFADRGMHYTTAIYYTTPEEKTTAEFIRASIEKEKIFNRPVVTKILPVSHFWPAEGYHQNYADTHRSAYTRYRVASGREPFTQRVWGSCPVRFAPVVEHAKDLKKRLTPLEYAVTKECGTEPPFNNPYWNNHAEGIYVDKISGKVLFTSREKFDSGTGWPSFTAPADTREIVEKRDTTHGMVRIEVRSLMGDAHLGHRFDDGPAPGGVRYCINSAALRFIKVEDLEREGYGKWREPLER